MEGSITQLQLDNYLINNNLPKKSFFSHSYDNYYNFAKDTRVINFDTSVEFGQKSSIRLDLNGRYGDLISNMVLKLELPDISTLRTSTGSKVGYCDGVGNAIVDEIELKIGGNQIIKHKYEFMDIWGGLSAPAGKKRMYNHNIKKYNSSSVTNFQGGTIYVPILFWFCQNVNANNRDNIALPFPLIAMNNVDIEFTITIKPINKLLVYEDVSTLSTSQLSSLIMGTHKLLVDYITLEPEERLKYLNAKRQMYLISQVQEVFETIPAGATTVNVNLQDFKYPITELLWICRSNNDINKNIYFNYSQQALSANNRQPYYSSAKIKFDNRDKLPELDASFFTDIETGKLHDSPEPESYVSCYGFSIAPENLAQPMGSCNFSGLHKPRLELNFPSGTAAGIIHVYAINYNVLQIDDQGNVWLLHNLSKSVPATLPDPNKSSYLNDAKLSTKLYNRFKILIEKINRTNLFTNANDVENSVIDFVSQYSEKSDQEQSNILNPILDTLHKEFDEALQLLLVGGNKRIEQLRKLPLGEKKNKILNSLAIQYNGDLNKVPLYDELLDAYFGFKSAGIKDARTLIEHVLEHVSYEN
jgi:hypothetical protein